MSEIINGFISCSIFLIAAYVFGVIIIKDKNKKENKKLYNIIIFLLSIVLYTMVFLLCNGIIKTILHCLILILIFRFIFNASYEKSLLASITYSILIIIPDLIVTVILSYAMGKMYFYNNLTGSIISNILVIIIMIGLILVLKKPLKKIFSYNLSTSKKIVFMSIVTILFIAYFFYKFAIGYKLNENIIVYLITIFAFMIILFTLFKQKIENEAISKKYDDLLNIMKTYENDVEEQRTIIHETRNELMTIKSKINDKVKEKEIIKYIDSILGDKTSSNISKYSKFIYLPSNGIKGFFYYKFMEAEKKDIKVSVNISKKIEKSFLGNLDTKDFKDLVRIIGVYLDNAIDASAESKEKKLGIEIYLIKDDIEIIISNTFENKIDTEKIGKERFTTKGKNHGHELLLVKHILHNNSIFESKNEIVNNLYIQTLKIKNNK